MSFKLPPLDPWLLAPLRESESAPADVRARAQHRLLSALAAPGSGGGAGAGGHVEGAGRTGTPAASVVALASLALLVGGVVGAGLYAALAPAPPARVVYVDRPGPQATSLPPSASPPAAIATIPSAPAASAPRPSPASFAHASQLSAERILLDEARAALAEGDPSRAIPRLELHRRRFPIPLLGEERDAMWIQALVKSGRYGEARARADAFRKSAPGSLFSSVVESSLASIP